MNNKSILVTGAAGLLGSRLVNWILENHPSNTVIGVDNLSGGYMSNIEGLLNNPSFEFHFENLDVSDAKCVESVFVKYKPDIVYHFAAYAAEALSPFIRNYNYTNNLISTANIVNMCIKYGVDRLVFTSSMAVYGDGKAPFKEDQPRVPIDPYGIAKSACEMDIEIAGTQHGLDWCIIRPHNVYGANQNIWDSYRNVLGIWMYKYINDKPLTIFGDGNQVRAFSCIDDSLEPLWRASHYKGASKQIINLGGIHDVSINEAASMLIHVMGGGELTYLPPRHEVKYAYASWEKSVDILGFEHKTNLYDGLTKMWEWAQTQPNRPRQVWENYEIKNGIYQYWNTGVLTSEANSVSLR